MHAKTRTNSDAIQIASSFLQTTPLSTMQKVGASGQKLSLSYKKSALKTANDSIVCYYVYNRGENNGYIIVSGDDRATPILGYSDSGNFDFSVIPENFKNWLSFYEGELKSLGQDNSKGTTLIKSDSPKKVKQINTFATSISPLLGGIKWNQDAPYNDLCPIIDSTTNDRAVTGCVATAMAQVMKYHEWPAQGVGSNSYTTKTLEIPLSLDFSQTTFDWDNMTDTYTEFSPQAQNEAVATLMYNCGVAADMDYNYASGAQILKTTQALKNNFGYDANLQLRYRDYYTRSEWEKFLKIELNAEQPVLYFGFTIDESGHAFVCDGYDSNNLYHFNWGWGGASNGYFSISALDPSEQGIGGSTSGFNIDQTIVTGLQKPTSTSKPIYIITTGDTLCVSKNDIIRNETFILTAKKLYNKSINTFNGSIGVALYTDSELIQVLSSTPMSLLYEVDWQSLGSTLDIALTFPESVENGNYQLYIVYKADGENNWEKVRGRVGTPNYLDVIVSSSDIKIKHPTNVYPELTVDSLSVTGNLYQDKTGRFNVSVTNTGEEYNSVLGVFLQSTTNGTLYQVVAYDAVNIAAGETRILQFKGTVSLEPGEYYLFTLYDPLNDISILSQEGLHLLGNGRIVNVLETPADSPILTLGSVISFPNSSNVDKVNAVLTATIKNTAGFYDNKLIAFIFPSTTGSSLTYLGYQDVLFDTNEEKEITFSGSINLEPGQYRIGVYSINETNAWTRIAPNEFSLINFTIADVSTDINALSAECFDIYPNPAQDFIKIRTSTSVHQIVLTDLLGKQIKIVHPAKNESISIPVEDLKSGTYLIRIETDFESKTLKFVKN